MSLPRAAVFVPVCCLAIMPAGCSRPTHRVVSLVASRPTSPSNGSSFSYYSQPITLTVASGVTTGGTLTTTTDVATDAGFTAIVVMQTVSR